MHIFTNICVITEVTIIIQKNVNKNVFRNSYILTDKTDGRPIPVGFNIAVPA
jgi:hypothetical protein